MKVFVDTNVLLEYLLKRDNYLQVRTLLRTLLQKQMTAYVSYLTFANSAYVLKRGRSQQQLHDVLKAVYRHVKVLNTTNRQIKAVLSRQPVRDFEDLLQYQCAKDNHCDVIVTFNKRDFAFADDINVQTPDELCRQLNKDNPTTTT